MHRIMDVLSLKEHHARTLLIHYRWDVDKVIAVFVEKGKDKLYAAAGVTVLEHDNLSPELSSTVMCLICMEEVSASEVTTMDCGHHFCNTCEYHLGKFVHVLNLTTQILNSSFLGVGQNTLK